MNNQAQTVFPSVKGVLPIGPCAPVESRSDRELIGQLQARGLGWKLAVNELLGRHRGWLVEHCTRRLGNRQDAQDVAQLVLIRAWQAIDRFEGRAAFRTWLYTIAENQCRTFMKQRMRYLQTEHIERLIELGPGDSQRVVTDDYAVSEAVCITLDQLGDTAREVLVLRFFQDCSLEEIAAALSISLSAAKMRLYRALDQFKAGYFEVAGCHPDDARPAVRV